MTGKEEFLCPYSSYGGAVDPRELVFDANPQEFAQRVGMISALENGGKKVLQSGAFSFVQAWIKEEDQTSPSFPTVVSSGSQVSGCQLLQSAVRERTRTGVPNPGSIPQDKRIDFCLCEAKETLYLLYFGLVLCLGQRKG